MVTTPASDTVSPRLTVYFDGGCPICAREIGMYRASRGADRIAWIDVDRMTGDSVAPGLSRADALGRFHVVDGTGRLRSGGAAFSALWQALPAYRVLGRLTSRWPLSIVLEGAYRLFLVLRPRLQKFFRACSRKAG
ncbi:MAG: thiol-disulfide oxidoreductase DCC family protein [Alphaproteobacteria bacterium]